jgi:hypothetical protein
MAPTAGQPGNRNAWPLDPCLLFALTTSRALPIPSTVAYNQSASRIYSAAVRPLRHHARPATIPGVAHENGSIARMGTSSVRLVMSCRCVALAHWVAAFRRNRCLHSLGFRTQDEVQWIVM